MDRAAHEHRVYGPPGTGKTTFLIRQASLAAKQYGPEAVMVASLTKAAAQEVAGRKQPLPKQNVGTLHAHAFHALGRPKIAESSAGWKSWNEWIGSKMPSWVCDDPTVLDVENAPLDAMAGRGTEGDLLSAEVAMRRAQMMPVELWRQPVQGFYEEWCEWKAERGFDDFTDLLEKALAEVDAPECAPSVFLLDEAQDFSRLELRLARKWGATCEHFAVVGDPDQNLYSWRGSDPEVFTEAAVESSIVLEQSHRVPREVHRFAVDWIETIPGREPIVYLPRDEDGEVDREAHFWQQPAMLVESVLAEIEAGRSVMVLTTCAYMVAPTVKFLRTLGVPFANPYRPTRGDWNPLVGCERLRRFLAPAKDVHGDDAHPWTWEDVQKWTHYLKARGLLKTGAKTLIESKAQPARFSTESPQAEIMTLAGLFEADEFEYAFDLDVEWWRDRHLDRNRKAASYGAAVYKQHGGRALIETPKLCVGTIHSVKGGEADTVYLFPDLSVAASDQWRNQGPGHDAIIRQFYVGMTRARQRLVLCGATSPALAVSY